MTRAHRRLCLILALLAWLPLARPASGQIVSRPIETSYRDGEVVIVRFFSGGQIDRAGRGLAVIDARDRSVGFKILANDPEGETVVGVGLTGATAPLTLRYSPKPIDNARPDDSVVPSLVLQTFATEKRAFRDINDLAAMLANTRPLGTTLVSSIFLGHNPFGPNEHFITLVQGELEIREDGDYRLVSIHDDAAFIEIDGRLVFTGPTANAGHGTERVVRQAVKVPLSAGRHRLRYVHVQTDGQTVAVMGYQPDETAEAIGTVPSHMFVQHSEAKLGPATGDTDRAPLAFDARQLDQLANDDFTFTRFELRPIAPAPAGFRYRFTFGDGTTFTPPPEADERRPIVRHAFPAPAEAQAVGWRVVLELVDETKGTPAGSAASVLRPAMLVSTRTIGDIQAVNDYAEAIAQADYAAATPELMAALYAVASVTERPDHVAPLVEPFVARFGNRTGTIVDDMKYTLATVLARSDPQRAATLFEELSRTAGDPWTAACAAAEQLDLYIFRLNRGGEVAQLVTQLTRNRTGRERALLRARLGDAQRVAGKLEEAAATYRDAQPDAAKALDANKAVVQERAHREKALSLLAQKRYPLLRQALLEWEAEFPIAKLGGDLPLLNGRYFQEIGDDARAAAEFRTILALNPLHPSRPEITFRLAQSLDRTGQREEAQKLYEKIAKDYPNSPFARESRYQPGLPAAAVPTGPSIYSDDDRAAANPADEAVEEETIEP